MTNENSAEPLYELIRGLRKPASLRELIAASLRSIYRRDPFSIDDASVPPLPDHLISNVSKERLVLNGTHCTVYRPTDSAAKTSVMMYMHGGGFVIGCSDDTDYATRQLCYLNKIVVVSVDYRLAPEAAFPAALTDCRNVLQAIRSSKLELNFKPTKIILGGDSAGGNLALAITQTDKNAEIPIEGLVLLAPWLDMELEKYSSFNAIAPTDVVMDAAFLAYARAAYVGYEDWKNPLASPIHFDVENLPPTIVIVGTKDPLLDQCIALQNKIPENKRTLLEIEIFDGMPHCFYSFPGLFEAEMTGFRKIQQFLQCHCN